MYMEERQATIAKWIEEKGRITIAEIVEKFGISNESARRDLRYLEEKGDCKRTHGGAIRALVVDARPPKERDMRTMEHFPNYEAIAKKAASMVKENETVYITSGSVGFLMLDYLPRDIHYTLIINSVVMGDMLRSWNNVDVYLVGGRMRMNSTGSLVDALAKQFINQFTMDRAFITGAGIEADFGFSNGTPETAEFQQCVIEHANKVILLMPCQKVGIKAVLRVCDAKEFDIMITDSEAVEEELLKLEKLGIEVVVEPVGTEA